MNLHPDPRIDLKDAAHRLAADPRWDIVILYDDVPAGRRALRTLDDASHKLCGKSRLVPQLWRFDLLEDPDWRAAAAAAAAQAALLIISASSKQDLPAAVQDWVRTCLEQRRGRAVALAALLGPADDTDTKDSPRVQLLRSVAEASEVSFFAPAPQPECSPKLQATGGLATGPLAIHSSRRILLLEDESNVGELITWALAGAGYQVDAVADGQSGWEALQARPYDLLVADNRMPGLFSGFGLIKRLRSAQMTLPVILASSGIGAEELTQNPWLEPAIALPKPFTAGQLLETVAEALHQAGHVPGYTGIPLPEPSESYRHWGLNE